jgi:excisionase family DNA binding protein
MNHEAEALIWMTVEEASTYLRVTPNTLYNYMKDGKLPYFYLAGTRHRRVKKKDVEALLVPGKPEDDSLPTAGG